MLEQKDNAIIAQSSAHDAAEIYAALVRSGVFTHWQVDSFEEIRQQILAGTIETVADLERANEQRAVATITQTFPGAEPFPTPPALPPVPGYATPAVGYDAPHLPAPQPGYVPQPQPQPGYPPPPMPPPIPQAPPAPGPGNCQTCGSRMYDNRNDNQRKRAGGFKLSADFKCSNKSCTSKPIWPADYQQYANCPWEPR